MKKFTKEMKVGVFFLCFAVFYIISSRNINTFSPFGHKALDSKSLPQLLGWLMIVLSIVLIVTSYVKSKKNVAVVPEKQEKKAVEMVTVLGKQLPKVSAYLVACCGLIALYTLFFRSLGFVVSTTLFLFLLTLLLAPKDKRTGKMIVFYAVFSVVFTVILYLLFTRAIAMMLPHGILG